MYLVILSKPLIDSAVNSSKLWFIRHYQATLLLKFLVFKCKTCSLVSRLWHTVDVPFMVLLKIGGLLYLDNSNGSSKRVYCWLELLQAYSFHPANIKWMGRWEFTEVSGMSHLRRQQSSNTDALHMTFARFRYTVHSFKATKAQCLLYSSNFSLGSMPWSPPG